MNVSNTATIQSLVPFWWSRTATRTEVQQLLTRLEFVTDCFCPGFLRLRLYADPRPDFGRRYSRLYIFGVVIIHGVINSWGVEI